MVKLINDFSQLKNTNMVKSTTVVTAQEKQEMIDNLNKSIEYFKKLEYTIEDVEAIAKKAWLDGNRNTDEKGMPNMESNDAYSVSNESYWQKIKPKILKK